MADYAIGLSFHKAHRTLVRAVGLNPPCRYFATRNSAGLVTLPTLDPGEQYIELQAVRQGSFQISDNNTDFRLLGDDGWNDSVITGSSVRVSVTTFFAKGTQVPAGQICPVFTGNYSQGFDLIQRARYDKNYEIYIEFLKELGPINGTSGNWYYDFTGFNGVMSNYQEQMNAEGLTEISFDLASRGRPIFGRYDAGSSPLIFGTIQANLLESGTGTTRQYAVTPANNASGINVANNVTIEYTTNGTTPIDFAELGQVDGAGFRLENASTGAVVNAVVTYSGGTVTINPVANLAAATIYKLNVSDNALYQAVDGLGSPSASGILRPIEGFVSTFRTA